MVYNDKLYKASNDSPNAESKSHKAIQSFVVWCQMKKMYNYNDSDLDSRCQPFLARRGPVVHLADILWLREYARRGPVVHRATNSDHTLGDVVCCLFFFLVLSK